MELYYVLNTIQYIVLYIDGSIYLILKGPDILYIGKGKLISFKKR